MTAITAEQVAEQLTRSVIFNISGAHIRKEPSKHVINSTINIWYDVVDTLRRRTQSCGGRMLNVCELDTRSGEGGQKLSIALFEIGKKEQREFIGATWNGNDKTCTVFRRSSEFPSALQKLLLLHQGKQSAQSKSERSHQQDVT